MLRLKSDKPHSHIALYLNLTLQLPGASALMKRNLEGNPPGHIKLLQVIKHLHPMASYKAEWIKLLNA